MTKILYVEDNEDDVYLLRMRLEQIEGFDFGVAKDGAAAIAAVAADAPDLILMDLNVPVIDTKPIDFDRLLGKMRRLLGDRRGNPGAAD